VLVRDRRLAGLMQSLGWWRSSRQDSFRRISPLGNSAKAIGWRFNIRAISSHNLAIGVGYEPVQAV
jgi:hypothetical protein